jgi:ribosomally synthesized peptide (two-chain TOMM family)
MLRAGWLRVIAQVWNDPSGVLLGRLVELSRENPRGILPYLEETFRFKFPFPSVKLAIDVDRQPRWKPIGTRGWFGFADEFEVVLPRKPVDENDQTELLAEYMQRFPSMLGRGDRDAEAPDDFAWFGLITGRLIALAWADDRFHQMLFAAQDARDLVQNAMDVVIPWNFRLRFSEREAPQLHAHELDRHGFLSAQRFDLDKLSPTVIRLNMPEVPDSAQRAIALAAYNDTGKQYPFTCG